MSHYLKLVYEVLPFLNISMHLNDIKFIRELEVKNTGDLISGKVKVRIQSDIPCIEPFEHLIEQIPAHSNVTISLNQLRIKRDFVQHLSENEKAALTIQLWENDQLVQTSTEDITVHSLDYFTGLYYFPQLVASYITPNHPYVYQIKKRALEILERNRQAVMFDGYQSGQAERVLQMMSAIFSAIKDEGIAYSSLPPGYENIGQRIRLFHTIQNEKFGNCIDISMLFAACLEAIDLHPIIVHTRGHAFVGCWLQEDTFTEMVNDDKTAITKRLAKGIRELAVVEATTVCKGMNVDFQSALDTAEVQLIGKEDFILSVDVKRARAARIRPLPLKFEANTIVLDEELIQQHAAPSMQIKFDLGTIYQDEIGGAKVLTKQDIWQRKLLDLSLRNGLLNIRMSRNMLQLVDVDVHHMEDRLSDGKSFTILPNPGAEIQRKYSLFIQQQHRSTAIYELATEELKRNRLLTYYHQEDLDSILSYMYKNAKLSIEESGSSTLYLAIGLLKWYDKKTPAQPRYAPILLIPVELSRRSVRSPFTLKSREEEAMINITLLELLRQEFELNLSHLEDLPMDEQGVDVAKVMAMMRRAVMSMKGWDVEEQLILGNFSFSKLILWKDIVVHQNEILKSSTVKSLIDGSLHPALVEEGTHTQDLETLSPSSVALPIPTDVSQMEAVLAAQQGKTFILHGPPGTGKSQTITNIIADALYQGKKVLFVAAKKAALDVVHKRMEQIGIDVFSLEMHSNRSKKSDILAQLGRTLELAKRARNFDFELEAKRLQEAKNDISQYVELLHQKQKIGWSLYDAISIRDQYLDENFKDVSIPQIQEVEYALYVKWQDILPQLSAIAQTITHPSQHPYRSFTLKNYSSDIQQQVQAQSQQLLQDLPISQNLLQNISDTLHFPVEIKDEQHWLRFVDTIQILNALPDTRIDLLTFLSTRENLGVIADWLLYFKKYQENVISVLQDFDLKVLNLDLTTQSLEWRQAEQSWFLPKWLKKRKIKKDLSLYKKDARVDNLTAEKLFAHAQIIQENQEILSRERFRDGTTALGNLYNEHQTNLSEIEQRVNALQKCLDNLQTVAPNVLFKWMSQWKELGYERLADVFASNQDKVQSFLQDADRLKKSIAQLEQTTGVQFEKSSEHWMEGRKSQIQKIYQYVPELRDWVNYVHIREQMHQLQMDWLIQAYESQIFDISQLQKFYEYSVANALAKDIISKNESLSLFNSKVFESKIDHYKNIAQTFRQITQLELFLKLSAQLPNVQQALQGSELGILQKAIKSRGRGLSIRRLFDMIPNLLPRLTPCMLMSPISVAQYFDVNVNHFDLVIFDEASQLPTCEAVSALSRAKQAIVVGDPKQMPPTSFFTTNKVDEENIEVEDLESILDDCLALSIPSKYLLRHYRSKHESLIAFSNAHYYDNKLLTFPSADDLNRKVTFYLVKGHYDKGKSRQNKAEAEAIVDFVLHHYSDARRRNRSVGIVTFSQVQQSLIEDKLQILLKNHPEIEQFIQDSPEPLFIKNLENVQGDERDIILFSVCYGPDEEGKVSMNFGPLNREGGWRRLNVAITRARYAMHIFSTLTSDMIDLNRTSSEGVAGLKGFLSYAEKGVLSLPSEHIDASQFKNNLSQSISKVLESIGLEVKTNIGKSGFKVDIGIVDKDQPGRYILGIITDGQYYFDAATSNDRELVMPSVLKGLGWNLYRVWTMDWYHRQDKIVEEILALIDKIKNQSPDDELMDQVVEVDTHTSPILELPEIEPLVEVSNLAQRPYEAAVLSSENLLAENIYALPSKRIIRQQMEKIVDSEAPVSKDYLFRKVLQAWGISRIGAKLESYLTNIAEESNFVVTHLTQPFYWKVGSLPAQLNLYRDNQIEKRNIEDIAYEEFWVAIEEVLIQNVSIEQGELMRYLCKLFGYSKVGKQIESVLNAVFNQAVKDGKIIVENNKMKLS